MADYILCGNITVKCGLKGKKEKNRMGNLRMMVMMMTFMIFYTFQTNIIKKKTKSVGITLVLMFFFSFVKFK